MRLKDVAHQKAFARRQSILRPATEISLCHRQMQRQISTTYSGHLREDTIIRLSTCVGETDRSTGRGDFTSAPLPRFRDSHLYPALPTATHGRSIPEAHQGISPSDNCDILGDVIPRPQTRCLNLQALRSPSRFYLLCRVKGDLIPINYGISGRPSDSTK
jgi:hypothetical protein